MHWTSAKTPLVGLRRTLARRQFSHSVRQTEKKNICFCLIEGQLRAKEELHRQEATLILKNLAHQCSDPGALEELINFVFNVLNGECINP